MTHAGYPPRPGGLWQIRPTVPGRQLRVMGAFTQVALFATVVVVIVWGFAVVHDRSLVNQIIDRPGSVTYAEAHQADADVHTSGRIVGVAYLITGIIFVTWLYLARRNADGYDPDVHRRARPWAFWGWVVPIVSLWFPFQVVSDTLRASSGRNHVPALMRVWWGVWLASLIVLRFADATPGSDAGSLEVRQSTVLVAIVLEIISGLLAAVVVGMLTASNDRRRAAILAAPPPPPEPPPTATPWVGWA